ncbi:adenylate cyclase associated protein CAP1 [Acrasis kona]|uniref:Adenylyl cyclase-associated protein n=1 Tax=Acrasis kona TaxID=1008807 RepID=A0AAW2ZP60_9EUKA
MSQSEKLDSLIKRLEAVTVRLENVQATGGSVASSAQSSSSSSQSSSAEASSKEVVSYNEYLEASLKPFLDISKEIGGDLTELATLVETSFTEVGKLINIASKSKKPSDQEITNLFKPISELFQKITQYKDARRGSDYYNHLFSVDEGIKCLQWPLVPNTPAPFVKEMVNSAEFYTNKVLVAYRSKDPKQVDWVNKFKTAVNDLSAYVKEYHTTGLKWNPSGGDAKSAAASSASAPSSSSSSSTPAPKPSTSAPSSGGAPAKNDLFAAINAKRDNAAGGLNKVTNDQKTKNRKEEDRVSVVPGELAKKGVATKTTGKKQKGPEKFELSRGGIEKWCVENFDNKTDLVISETSNKQGVYILNCTNCVITIKGKVNIIIIDSCQKTGVILDDAVSSVEMVNSQGIKVQVNGNVPTVNVDKTDGVQIFLSKSALGANIITSKSSEMNVCVPDGDDYTEIPIPEQYQSKWDSSTKKVVTEVVTLNM